jgi:ribosomal protein S18 acetylase RimI-like enzyme
MSLQIRRAETSDYAAFETMVIDSFGPITWARTLDEKFGPLNGLDWRARWKLRLQKIFAEQIVLLGEVQGSLIAASTSTLDAKAALAYIEILATAQSHQGRGYGREMLRITIRHMQELGAQYVNLDCLTNNDKGNALYVAEGFEEVARHIRWFKKI